MSFDPDAYLSEGKGAAPAAPSFDPDAYLSADKAPAEQAFNPDAYLAETNSSAPTLDQAEATLELERRRVRRKGVYGAVPDEDEKILEMMAAPTLQQKQAAFRSKQPAAPVDNGVGAGQNLGSRFARGAINEGVISGVQGVVEMTSAEARKNSGKFSVQAQVGRDMSQALRNVKAGVEETFPVNPTRTDGAEGFAGDVVAGVGQMVGQAPLMAVGGGVPALALTGGQMFQQGFEDATAKGASEDDAVKAGLLNMPATATEFLADKLIIGKAAKPLTKVQKLKQLGERLAEGFASEAPTEGAQQAWQNYIANSLVGYDPERRTSEGVAYSAAVGGVTGATVAGGGAALQEGVQAFAKVQIGKKAEPVQNLMDQPEALTELQQDMAKAQTGETVLKKGPDIAVVKSGKSVDQELAEQLLAQQPAEQKQNILEQMGYDPADFGFRTEKVKLQEFEAGLVQKNQEGQAQAEIDRAKAGEQRQAALAAEQAREANKPAPIKLSPEEEQAAADERAYLDQLEADRRLAEDEALGDQEDIVSAVRSLGGLPARSEVLTAELEDFRKSGKGTWALFKKSAPSLDKLAEGLREKGFDIQTPAEVIEAMDGQIRSGKKVYAAALEAEGSQFRDAPVPESAETVATQMQWLNDGRREAAFFPPGTQIPTVPKGLKTLPSERGTFVFNPDKVSPERLTQALNTDTLGDVLGYGIARKPAPEKILGDVTLRDSQGREKLSVLTDAENFRSVVQRMEKLADPGDTLSVESGLETIQERLQASEQSPVTRAQRAFQSQALERVTKKWLENYRKLAPGLARQYNLEVSTFSNLKRKLERGDKARRVPGGVQAAIDAHNQLFYLVAEHLLNNSSDISLLNLQHEMGHAYQRTLDGETLGKLRKQFQLEIQGRVGPLFQLNGKLKPGVALGVESNFNEWFAERLAWANQKWAQGRIEPDAVPGPDAGLIEVLAYEFRQLLKALARILNEAFTQDEMLRGFREFLDQGDRWQAGGIDFVERDGLGSSDDSSRSTQPGGVQGTPPTPGEGAIQPAGDADSSRYSQAESLAGPQRKILLSQELAVYLRSATSVYKPRSTEVSQIAEWPDKIVKILHPADALSVGKLNDHYGRGITIDTAPVGVSEVDLVERILILNQFNSFTPTEILGWDELGRLVLEQPRADLKQQDVALDNLLSSKRAVWVSAKDQELTKDANDGSYVVQAKDQQFYFVQDLRKQNVGTVNGEALAFDLLVKQLTPADLKIPTIANAVTEIENNLQDHMEFVSRPDRTLYNKKESATNEVEDPGSPTGITLKSKNDNSFDKSKDPASPLQGRLREVWDQHRNGGPRAALRQLIQDSGDPAIYASTVVQLLAYKGKEKNFFEWLKNAASDRVDDPASFLDDLASLINGPLETVAYDGSWFLPLDNQRVLFLNEKTKLFQYGSMPKGFKDPRAASQKDLQFVSGRGSGVGHEALEKLKARIAAREAWLANIRKDINAQSGPNRELTPKRSLSDLRANEKDILAELAELRAQRDDLIIDPESPAPAAVEEAGAAPIVQAPEGGYSIKAKKALGMTYTSDAIPKAIERAKGLVTGFLDSLPELPVFSKSQAGQPASYFATFREGYRQLKGSGQAVQKDAEMALRNILEPINQPGVRDDQSTYNVFRRVLVFRDLYFRSQQIAPGGTVDAEGNPRTLQLPEGMEAGEVKAALIEAQKELNNHPQRDQIEEALRRHYEFIRKEVDELARRDYIIPDEMKNPFYYPHKILKYWDGKIPNVAISPSEDFRGYLQPLKGSVESIEMDYVKAMYAHMVDVMSDNRRMDLVAEYWQRYDIKGDLQAEAKRMEKTAQLPTSKSRFRALIPEGYKEVAIDQRILLRGEFVVNRQKLADRLGIELTAEVNFQSLMREMGIKFTADDIRETLIAAEERTWVVPVELAEALNNLVEREKGKRPEGFTGAISAALAKLQTFWKINTLFNPLHVFRYTFNNMVSDIEKVYTADPGMVKQMLPAWKEIQKFYLEDSKGFPSKEFEAAFKRGVMESVTAQEVGQITELQGFENFKTTADKVKGVAGKAVSWGVEFNKLREALFRYSKFRADLDRIRNKAEPEFAGARRADIKELIGQNRIEDAAAKIARETFVDYGAISVNGDQMRQYMAPFFSWTEGNFRYHANLFRNYVDMAMEGERLPANLTGAAARAGITVASKIVVPKSLLGFSMRLILPWVAVQIWNNMVMGDEEDELSEEDKRRFHLVVGRDDKGQPMVIYTPTAFADVIEWFSGSEAARQVMSVLQGEREITEGVEEFAKGFVPRLINRTFGQLGPTFKLPYEILAKKATFPDVLDQRSIPDYRMKEHILGQMIGGPAADIILRATDSDYYAAKDVSDWALQLILQVRKRDPEQWAYFAIRDKVEEFNAGMGKNNEPGTSENDITPIARNFRRAVYRGDLENAVRFYNRLVDLGYTSEQFAASARNQDPLSGLPKAQRKEFVEQLAPYEMDQIYKAYSYYAKIADLGNESKALFPRKKDPLARQERFRQNPPIEKVEKIIMQNQIDPARLEKVQKDLLKRSLEVKR